MKTRLLGAAVLCFYLFQVGRSFFSLTPKTAGVNLLYVWYLLAAGLAVLPCAFFIKPVNLPRISLTTVRFLTLGLFGMTVVILKNIDVTWLHYRDTGLTVIVYTLCRLILAVTLFVLCLVVGSLALRRPVRQMSDVIYHFFCGASIYGLAVTALGLMGWLNLWVALGLALPFLYMAPAVIASLDLKLPQWDPLDKGAHFLLGWLLVFGAGFLVFSNGLYPGPIMNDEWEHYLHYYRAVLQHGSLAPNEVWYHFYVSKGAGLFYLSGLLSDFLSAQLVSLCFALMTALIVFDLLKSITRQSLWALTGAILFLTLYDGAYFRHHVVLTGYIAFLIWACIRLLENPKAYRTLFRIVAPLSAFYIGFYLPPAASLLALFFGVAIFVSLCVGSLRPHLLSFSALLVATLAGVAVAMGLNVAFTGLAEMVPLKTFWAMADTEKFGRVFGTVCAQFFLQEQSHMTNIIGFKVLPLAVRMQWFNNVFRTEFFAFIHFPVLFGLAAAVLTWRGIKKRGFQNAGRQVPWLFVIGLFLSVALLMSQVALIASTYRLFIFSVFFLTILGVVLVKFIVDTFTPMPWKRPLGIALCVFLCVSAMAQTAKGMDTTRVKSIGSYIAGRQSIAGVMAEADRHFTSPASLRLFEQLREKIGRDKKVLCLSYFPSPGYSFPGVGIVSEPSYTHGVRQNEIMEGTPEQAKAVFQERGIDYFIMTRRSIYLPSTSILAPLFHARNLERMFKVVLTDNDNYVLTWREPEDTEPMPTRLIQTMELRQERPLYYPFSDDFSKLSEDFARRVDRIAEQTPMDGSQEELAGRLTTQIMEVLKVQMLSKITLPENKTLLTDLLSAIEQRMFPQVLRLVQQSAELAQGQPDSQRQLIRQHLAEFIRPPILQIYTEKANQDPDEVLKFSLTYVAYQLIQKID